MKKIALILLLTSIVACSQNPAEIVYNDKKIYNKDAYHTENYYRGAYRKSPDGRVVRDLSLKDRIKSRAVADIKVEKDIPEREQETNNSSNELVVVNQKAYDKNNFKETTVKRVEETPVAKQPIAEKKVVIEKPIVEKRQDGKYKYVIVNQGENLFRIAKNNNVPFKELADLNGIQEPYNISVGQEIKIPLNATNTAKSQPVAANNNTTNNTGKHEVKAGETMYSISKMYDMTVEELAQKNNIPQPYTLSIGQQLDVNKTNENKNTVVVVNNNAQKQEEKIEVKQPVVVKSDFIWPVNGEIVAKFGDKVNEKIHDGINIKASKGTAIKASKSGEVAYAGNELKGYGNLIILRHENNQLSIYAYCDTLNVKVKDKVNQGDIIATVGNTGSTLTPQLYFSIREGRKSLDPLTLLPTK